MAGNLNKGRYEFIGTQIALGDSGKSVQRTACQSAEFSMERAMSGTRMKTAFVIITTTLLFSAGFLLSGDRLPSADSPADAKSMPTQQTGLVTGSQRPIRVNVQLVLVNVSVIDPDGRFVTGLGKENFSLYEDKQPQSISHFSKEDVPISIGLLFDASGSMRDKIDAARTAVLEFFRTANPSDEFFLVGFNDRPFKIADFTQDTSALMSKLNWLVPKGSTALLDAIYLGLHEMRRAKYSRKALLIFSDGGDNHSRYSEGDLKRAAQESDTQIYAVGIHWLGSGLREERFGPQLLTEITEKTGGRHFMIENLDDLPDVASKIGQELRDIYTLGYTPSRDKRDGKWRKIEVKLVPPRGLRSLRSFAKSGYYAPQP